MILVILLMFIVIDLVSGGLIEVALPTLVHGPMHGGASSYGLILAAWGALIGSLFACMLGKHKGLFILQAVLVVATAIGLLPIGGVIGAVACMLIGGVANSIITVLLFTAIQLVIPSHLMGRVMDLPKFSYLGCILSRSRWLAYSRTSLARRSSFRSADSCWV